MKSTSQTSLLKVRGLAVRGFRGQHLLLDPNIQRKIVALLRPKRGEGIVEIGPGLGAITRGILEAGAKVIAIEKDRQFCEILEETLGREFKGRLKIVNADVLKTDFPAVIARPPKAAACLPARQEAIAKSAGLPACPSGGLRRPAAGSRTPRNDGFKLVSNLPYYITTPILFWLIDNRRWVKKAVLMMQREVARRLLAEPGDKDYGRLTLALRYYAEVRRAFDVSRNCFTPRPEVDSTVVILEFHPSLARKGGVHPSSKFPKGIGEDLFFHVIKTAFGARRKTLLNRLSHDPRIKKSRDELSKILRDLGILETARAEELRLQDFLALSKCLS